VGTGRSRLAVLAVQTLINETIDHWVDHFSILGFHVNVNNQASHISRNGKQMTKTIQNVLLQNQFVNMHLT
jgi:hypothetical protein